MSDPSDAVTRAAQLFANDSFADDRRFALWAARKAGDEDAIVLCSRQGDDSRQAGPPSASSPSSPSTSQILQNAPSQRAVPWMAGKQSQKQNRKSVWESTSSNDIGGSGSAPASRARPGTANGSSTSTSSNSLTTATATAEDSHHSILFPSHGPFLIAASMPCIVAELTSHIDNRLMTDFFYTYRAYVSSHELLRLLIARFYWTLVPFSPEDDEAKRNIVRVRTYVVIKYWLTNFFTMDFLPDRALREQFTDWLNGFPRSVEHLPQAQRLAGVGIVKNLKKIVRNLKAAYEKTGIGGLLMADEAKTPRILSESSSQQEGLDELASHDDYVNLAMGDEASDQHESSTSSPRSPAAPGDGHATKPLSSLASPTSASSSRAKQANLHSPSVGPNAPPPLPTSQGAISRVFVNTFSRLSRFKRHLNARSSVNPFLGEGIDGTDYDTNNCGDLLFMRGGLEGFLDYYELRTTRFSSLPKHGESDGNGKSSSGNEDLQDPSASDGATARDEETPSLSSNQTRSTPASSFDLSHGSPVPDHVKSDFGLGISSGDNDADDERGVHDDDEQYWPARLQYAKEDQNVGLALSPEGVVALQPQDAHADLLHHFQSDQTLRSASRARPHPSSLRMESRSSSSFDRGSASASRRTASGREGSVVLIDDVDLSSDEDDGIVRRALRRLPAARDLRTAQNVAQLEAPVRQSFDSVSSFGRVYEGSRRSLASYFENGSADEASILQAHKTSIVTSEMLDPDEALRGFELVKGFRLEHLEDSDDDEVGDVEAALRRLEGVIDFDKERERARKVESMWQKSQARQQEDYDKRHYPEGASVDDQPPSASESVVDLARDSHADHQSLRAGEAGEGLLTPSQSTATIAASGDVSALERDSIQLNDQGRSKKYNVKSSGMSVKSNSSRKTKTDRSVSPTAPLRLPRSVWAPPPAHRSFLLDYHSDIIAQQLSLIEAELFRAVAWQELVSGQWKVKNHPGPVNDWESFYQSRARSRVRAQKQHSTGVASDVPLESSVEAITARFKLTCNWVASEIVLTNNVEIRAAVVRKLIRIAWKCYHHSNFATLTQIILGLQTPSVERLSKTWARVGVLEMRMLRDLKAFINPAGNFKHLRNAMRDMMIEGHMEDLIISSGPPQQGAKGGSGAGNASGIVLNDGCIPFFGLFMSDLAIHDSLPTFVDPSSPEADVSIDPSTGYLTHVAKPAAFDHLPPLPQGVHMSPLVNMYKYRILAMTVKSVLALQERLEVFNFPINRGVYVKSLKLRCLEPEQLNAISQMAEP